MSKRLPIIAIIGQTNAGKSSLFNRLVGQKTAIVAREAGTTRDNVIQRVNDRYILIDTAGLKDPSDDFEASIRDQIEEAIATADLILLTLDRSKYTNHDDKLIAKQALKSQKPTFLVLNKSDLGEALPETEFYNLGIKDLFANLNSALVIIHKHSKSHSSAALMSAKVRFLTASPKNNRLSWPIYPAPHVILTVAPSATKTAT